MFLSTITANIILGCMLTSTKIRNGPPPIVCTRHTYNRIIDHELAWLYSIECNDYIDVYTLTYLTSKGSNRTKALLWIFTIIMEQIINIKRTTTLDYSSCNEQIGFCSVNSLHYNYKHTFMYSITWLKPCLNFLVWKSNILLQIVQKTIDYQFVL